MNGITRMGCGAALVVVLGALVASPALALDNPWITTLTSTQGNYTDNLTATVTWEGDHFHYLYELDFQHTYVRPSDHYSYPLTVPDCGQCAELCVHRCRQ